MIQRSVLLALSASLMALAAPGQAMPGAAQDSFAAATKALARGDGIAAEADLQRALQAGASKSEIAAAMGEALIDQGAIDKAREWLAPGQFSPAEAGHGWRMLGMLERLTGNLGAAGKAYDQALKVSGKDPLLWVEIGRMRYSGGEQLQAVDAAERALAAAPDNPRALEFKAELVRDAQGYAAAIPLYERALEANGNDLALLGGYAAALGEAGRASDMLAVTRHMLEVAPHSPRAFFLQAVLAARAGQIDLARSLLSRTKGKLATDPAGMLLQGLLDLEAGNANVAADELAVLADRQPANQRVQLLLARALYASGDYNQLFTRFGALAQRSDASPYLLTLLGRANEDQGNRAAAAALLDRAAAPASPPLQPIFEADSPAVLGSRFAAEPSALGLAVPYVRSLLVAGNRSAAAQAAGQFLRARPGSDSALGLLGDVELYSGAPGAALQHYDLAARVRFPDLLLLRMGEAFVGVGQPGAAQPVVARYLAAFPGSRLAARMAANMAALAGDWQTAAGLLDNLRLRGGNQDVRLLADLSFAQLRSGDASAALISGQRAWELQPNSPVAAQALGMAMAEVGEDTAGARQLLLQARRMGGDNPLLQAALTKLH
ncbi:MAG: tetratricopeptide repeat protein [Pseudomonadota bacterium]|nr:tetratricopeptide repeat protein [Pseudomonadota bacterium]